MHAIVSERAIPYVAPATIGRGHQLRPLAHDRTEPSDTGLLLQARGGDELAFARLLDRHRPLLWFHASQYFAPGLEQEDLLAEARWGFAKAVRDYKAGKGVTFRHFAGVCVKRQVITAVKTAKREKHGPLNTALSYNTPISDGGDSTLEDILPNVRALDPADAVVQGEELEQLIARFGLLTDLERKAVTGLLNDRSYEDLAVEFGVSVKTIDNALQRGRRKLAGLVGAGAGGAEARVERPTKPTQQGALLPSRPRQRRPGRSGPPTTKRRGGTTMSITDAIDAEKASVKEELDALEAQLDQKRTYLDGLDELAEKAEALTGGGTGVDVAPPPPAEPPAANGDETGSSAGESAAPFREVVLAYVRNNADVSGVEIAGALDAPQPKVSAALTMLAADDLVESRKDGRSKRWSKKGSADRPNPAPPRQGRAAAAPAKKPESRPDPKPPATAGPPMRSGAPAPSSAKAEAKMRHNQRLRQAIIELVADSEPIEGREIDTMLLEQIPEAEKIELVNARRELTKEGRLAKFGEQYRIPASTSTPGPITNAEKEAVACLEAGGRTAQEIALRCEAIANSRAAAAIAEGLVRRSVLQRRPKAGPPPVYERAAGKLENQEAAG